MKYRNDFRQTITTPYKEKQPYLFNHVAWRVETAHPKGALQEPKNGGEACAESSEILKRGENKAGGLFMVVGRENGNDNQDEGEKIPDEKNPGDAIQKMWAVDVDCCASEGDQICEEDGMPALDGVIRE